MYIFCTTFTLIWCLLVGLPSFMHQYNTFFTLRSVLPYNRLRFINIRIILENLDFQAYRIFLQTDQSLHTTQAYKIIRMCRKDCSQFMKVDSCKLRIMVQESKREVENSNQRKKHIASIFPLCEVNVYLLLQAEKKGHWLFSK